MMQSRIFKKEIWVLQHLFMVWVFCLILFNKYVFFCTQADARKAKLLDSYDLQRFLSDYR